MSKLCKKELLKKLYALTGVGACQYKKIIKNKNLNACFL